MAKIKSFGTTVTVAGTAIGALRTINPNGAEVPTFDVTTHDSTAKEYVAGLIENGTLELEGLLDFSDAGQDYLRAHIGETAAFVITLTNSKTISFSAIIGGMNEDIPLEDGVGFSISCKITGAKSYSS